MVNRKSALYLIATNHLDLYEGPRKLRTFLEKVKPTHIVMEGDLSTALATLFRKRETTNSLRGYELWVPKEYASSAEHEVRLVYTNDTIEIEIPKDLKDAAEGLADRLEKREVDDKRHQEKIDNSYDETGIGGADIGQYCSRDSVMERVIRGLYEPESQTCVFIGGLLHVFGNYENLHQRLEDLRPERIKLRDADNEAVLRKLLAA